MEQAFYNMMYKQDSEIDILREKIAAYLNSDSEEYKKDNLKDLMLYAGLKECEICGHIDLEENLHENIDGLYCDVCWEAK